jgi:hypothetical protein
MYTALKLSSLTIAGLVVVVLFVSATSYPQLALAICLYIPLVYVAFRALQHKTDKKPLPMVAPPISVKSTENTDVETSDEPIKERVAIVDIDKRAFLKMVGSLGLSVFLLSIFNKRTGDIFSGTPQVPETVTLKNSAGDKIDPVERQPTDGYRISEIDNSDTSFYGYTNKDGAWFIMKEDINTGSFRYTRGDGNFPDNWNNRENFRYDYFSNVFKA